MTAITWKPVTATMIQSDDVDHTYQISRTPKKEHGRYTYRAWHRATSTIVAAAECFDEAGDRAAAISVCKEACVRHLAGAWAGAKS